MSPFKSKKVSICWVTGQTWYPFLSHVTANLLTTNTTYVVDWKHRVKTYDASLKLNIITLGSQECTELEEYSKPISIIKGYLMHRDQLMHNHLDVFALPSGCLCSKAAFNTSQATIFLLPAISFPNWCRIGSPLRHVVVGKSSTKRKYYLI